MHTLVKPLAICTLQVKIADNTHIHLVIADNIHIHMEFVEICTSRWKLLTI